MLRLARFGVVAAGILAIVHGASVRSAEGADLAEDGVLYPLIEESAAGDLLVSVDEVPITMEVAAEEAATESVPVGVLSVPDDLPISVDEEPIDVEMVAEEAATEPAPVSVLSVPDDLPISVDEEPITVETAAEEASTEEAPVSILNVLDNLSTSVDEEPITVETAAEEAPVGVLNVPDDILPATDEEVYSAASAEEESSSAMLASSVDQVVCPNGTGRPANDPQGACQKSRGNVEGFAFIDDNRNLSMDISEVGLPGILLTISNKAATFRASVRTDATGRYQITNLPPGAYYLTVDLSSTPAGLVAVYDQVTIAVQPFTTTTQDFPFQAAAPLTTKASGSICAAPVFIDVNGNGIYDASDVAVHGVVVKLTSNTANPVTITAKTDEQGMFEFTELESGTYTVSLDASTIPADTIPTRLQFQVTVGQDECVPEGEFRLSPPAPTAKIGPAYVFVDTDKNSVQGSGEAGMPDVIIRLVKDGLVLKSTVSNSQGLYQFENLAAGVYVVQIDLSSLPAYYSSLRPQGKLTATLVQGQQLTDASFPILAPAKGNIGQSTIYSDLNNNGAKDSGEPGVPNILVNLVDVLGQVVANTRSDRNGNFKFDAVLVGTYKVEVDTRSVPAKYILYAPSPASVTVTEGATSVGVTIRAVTKYATIGPAVAFVDANENGSQDANEAPVPGVTVMLLSNAKLVQTTKTDQAGKYTFSNIQPGNYTVRVDRASIPYGYETIKPEGEYTIVLSPSQTATGALVDIPFKLLTLSRIRGVVKNATAAMANVKVSVLDSAGVLLSDTLTNDKGVYSFTNLPAGTYNLQVDPTTIPTGLIPGDKKTGKVAATVTWGDNLTVNFKYKSAYGTIGPGVVFVDANANEVLDLGEVGLATITIDLMQTNGKVVSTTKTDASGKYEFKSVAPGNYEVRVIASTVPPRYTLSRVSYMLKLKAAQILTGTPANFAVTSA